MLFFFLIFIRIKKKDSYYIDNDLFINRVFKILENKNIANCKRNISYRCISFKQNIINVYKFKSNNIYYQYKQGESTLIKDFHINKNKIKMKYINMNSTTTLNVFAFKKVLIAQSGCIYSKCWEITIVGGCKCSYLPYLESNTVRSIIYDKVISITHYWGYAVFHSIVECLPKLGYYIPELLADTSIKIHLYRSPIVKYLELLGFNISKLIFGNIYAKRLIVLEKGGCGSTPPLLHLLSLRNYLRDKIHSNFKYSIVIIKRIGMREILNFNEIYNTIVNTYGKDKIAIFYPNTSFSITINLFKYAKLIIAPHGAGLSNIILSYNCTIIEFVQVNLCYWGLAYKLGLRYYGVYDKLINNKFYINISFFKTLLKDLRL